MYLKYICSSPIPNLFNTEWQDAQECLEKCFKNHLAFVLDSSANFWVDDSCSCN